MTAVLVTGSSRGIGLELVKSLTTHPKHPDIVIATCRDPSKATELTSLAKNHPHLKILQLDVEKFETYPEIVTKVDSIVGENGLNLLINNAGVAHRVAALEEVTFGKYENVIKTNVFAPVFLTQALLPLLKKSSARKQDCATGIMQTAVINISSILGSVTKKQDHVAWGYNESKAALNQVTRSLANNFEKYGILAVAIHPGWVQTDMGGPEALLTVQDSVSGLINIIYNLTQDHNDKFLTHEGTELPW